MRLAIKGSIAAYDTAAALVTTAGEELHQIVTEARAELTPVLDPMPPSEDITPHIIRPEGASA